MKKQLFRIVFFSLLLNNVATSFLQAGYFYWFDKNNLIKINLCLATVGFCAWLGHNYGTMKIENIKLKNKNNDLAEKVKKLSEDKENAVILLKYQYQQNKDLEALITGAVKAFTLKIELDPESLDNKWVFAMQKKMCAIAKKDYLGKTTKEFKHIKRYTFDRVSIQEPEGPDDPEKIKITLINSAHNFANTKLLTNEQNQ